MVHDVLAECERCRHLASLPGKKEKKKGLSLFSYASQTREFIK